MLPLELKLQFDSFRPRLHQEIQSCLTLLQAQLGPWPEDTTQTEYWKKLKTYTTSGKLRRGSLMLIALRRPYGERASVAYRLGAWLEILHSGFLIHDDIIDNDHKRRGKPSFHAYLSEAFPRWAAKQKRTHHTPEQSGRGLSIALGEYLIMASSNELNFLNLPDKIANQVSSYWNQTIVDTMAGQIRDITGHLAENISKADILETARLKTSGYSFSLPLYCSGLLAGLNLYLCERLAQLGHYLGICLQLQDDQDGLLKTTVEIGKTPGTDLKDNTMTFWRWHLDKVISPQEKYTLNKIYGSPTIDPDDLTFVRHLYQKYDLTWKTEVQQERLLRRAHRIIRNTNFPHFLHDRLIALTNRAFL